jgi:formamidopyrimidine-DNA glycosylase
MPELPEVQHAAAVARAALVGRTIAALRLLHPALRRGCTDAARDAVAGRRVVHVERRGKHQLVHLDDAAVLHVHFRMSGDWVEARAGDVPRHARAALDLTDGSALVLVDPRALSTVDWHAAGALSLPPLGLDALDPALDGAALGVALAGRRGPIKPALLDQRVVAGLGNIYAVEALWLARVDPRLPARSLGPVRRERLVVAVRATLASALDVPGRYSRGETVEAMRVYGRAGAPCLRCGAGIARIVQVGRSTYYCPRCQAR